MIYLYINKITNELRVFGSLVALCSATGLKKDRFYTHFGRNKNKDFENEEKDFITSEDMIEKLGLEKQNNSFLHIVMRSLSKYKESILGGVIGCIAVG